MTDWLMTNPRHRNERLTVFSAASNKQRRSCPGQRCFENSSLISWASAGHRYLSCVICWWNIGNAYVENMPAMFAIFVMFITSHHWQNVFGGLLALRMAQGLLSVGVSLWVVLDCLAGWLAMDFRHSWSWMMLSARQQKGHPSSWCGLPLRRGHSSWMVIVREWMQVCAASWNRGSTWWWQVVFAGVAYVSSINDGA